MTRYKFKFVIQGQEVSLWAEDFRSAMKKCLKRSGNIGPVREWQLRDLEGNVIDLDWPLDEYVLNNALWFYMNRRAGIGATERVTIDAKDVGLTLTPDQETLDAMEEIHQERVNATVEALRSPMVFR